MGASWIEIEMLLKQLDDVTSFPHSEALMPVARARDSVAEAAMIVSRAALSGDAAQESEARVAMARARVTIAEAQVAVRIAREAVELSKNGCGRAQQLIDEARRMRARDGTGDRRQAPRPEVTDRRAKVAPSGADVPPAARS